MEFSLWRAPAAPGALGPLAFVCLALLVVAPLRAGLFLARRLRRREELPKAASAFFRRICLTKAGGETAADPEVEEQVQESVAMMQVKLARLLIPCTCFIMFYSAAELFYCYLSDIPTGRSMVQDVSFVLIFAGAVLCTLWPRLMGDRSLAWWHVYFMTTLFFITSPFVVELGSAIPVNQTRAWGGSMAASFLCIRFPVLLASNVVYSALWILALFTSIPHESGVAWWEMFWLEVSYCMLKIAIFRFLTRLVDQSVRGEVESRAGVCQRWAVSSLLGMMCDVVVDLDQNLTMKEHEGKLACMLMHGTGTTLHGRPLTEFLAAGEDCQRFKDAVARCASLESGTLSPSMINIRLRDSIGNALACVLHHVPYRSVAGRIHHLVGLREETERVEQCAALQELGGDDAEEKGAAPAAAPGRAEMPAAELTEAVLRGVRQTRRRPQGTSRIGSRSSWSSRSSRSSRSSGSSDRGDEEWVVEVFASNELKVNRVSQSFAQYFGVTDATGLSFRSLLPMSTGATLTEWLCEQSRKVESGEREASIMSFGEVEVAVPVAGCLPAREICRAEVCFPKPHAELQRRRLYLAGIRLTPVPDGAPPGRAAPLRL